MKRKFRMPMLLICILIALIPMSTLGTFLSVFFTNELKTSVYQEVEDQLNLAATALQEYCTEDYMNNSGEFSYYYNFIDSLKTDSMDLSLIVDDERYLTTLTDNKGQRKEGTTIDSSIYRKLKLGDTYYSEDTEIEGETYTIYYEPIFVEGKYVGAVAAMHSLEDIENTISNLMFRVARLTTIVFATFVAIVFYVAYIIARPLKQVSKVLDDTSNGKLNDSFKIKSICKETVNLINSTRTLNTSLADIISSIHESSDTLSEKNTLFLQRFNNISDSTVNINTAIEEIAQGSSSQAQDTESIASQVQDLSMIVDNTSSEAKNLEDICSEMNTILMNVDGLLNNLIELNMKVESNMGVVDKQTKATNESVLKIKEAVAVIQDIASQTNLLSLNASIEAARAGENGRGFAVVAGEIRNLASSSASSADSIDEIIKDLVSNSEESVNLISGVVENTVIEQQAFSETSEAFKQLKEKISAVSKTCDNVNRQVEVLNNTRGGISASTENLSAVSEENAASTEETSASMQELSGIVEACMKDVQVLADVSDDLKSKISIFNK